MVKRFLCLIFVFAFCTGTVVPAMAAAPDWLHEDEIISGLETSVYINGEHIVDRVIVDKDMELSFKLREFMEHLGYTVNWNEENQSVEMVDSENRIEVYVGSDKCKRNGFEIDLGKPVYMENGISTYFPQSFLRAVLDMEIVSLFKGRSQTRIENICISSLPSFDTQYISELEQGHHTGDMNPDDVLMTFVSGKLPEKKYTLADFELLADEPAKKVYDSLVDDTEIHVVAYDIDTTKDDTVRVWYAQHSLYGNTAADQVLSRPFEWSVPVIKSVEFLDENNTPLPMDAGWNLLQDETKINVIYEGEATHIDFYATPSGTETIYMQKLIGIVDVQKEDRSGQFEWEVPDGFMGHIWVLVYNGDVARISDTVNAMYK